MAYIDSLQSEPTPEPIIETEETKVHPLLQAMQELKEEGVIDEYVNKDTVTPGFKKEKWIMGGKYKLVATARDRDDDKDAEGLIIKVIDPTDDSLFRPGEVGSVRLIVNGDGSYEDKALVASLLGVNDSHQRKGLASAMYQFARELGNDILPSKAQSDMGKAFWKGGAGVGKEFPEELPPEPEAKQEPVEPEVKPEEKKPFWKRLFKEDEYTFNQERRQLNIPELIKRGAFYITHPHGPDGWETDRPDWDFSLITLQNILQKSPDWSVEYKKYIRPESYNKATQEFFSKLSDQKYQQILWSINKLGIPDDAAFLDKLDEASPDTLEGSFTPDLVESKTWLAKMLAKGLKGKNAGTIYVLGSWYGNMGIFLQQEGIKFKKLVLVEPDEEALMRSKELLDTLNDDGKLILIHQNAEDVVYEKPGVVINTSCNETGPVFLTKLPDNMLCLLQARNNTDDVLFETDSLEEFIEYYPLNKTYYTGEKELIDPETEYTRYMIIGRTGKSQSINENSGFDQEAGIGIDGKSFKFKIRDLVAFADDYPVTEIDPKQFIGQIKDRNEDPVQSMARAKAADLQYPIIVVKRKNGNLWIADGTHRAHKAILKKLPTIKAKVIPIEDMTPFAVDQVDETISTGQGGGSAGNGGGQMVGGPTTYEQEYNMFKSKGPRRITAMTNEALDSSYPYEGKAISGRYTFETEDGVFYKVYFQGKDLVEIAFSAILPGEEENFRPDKTTITGTGNSRKVFGTVIKIVQDYVDAHEPKALYFIAGDEPSRIRLYQTMTDQVGKALPDYYAVKPTDLGAGKAFMLKRRDTKIDEALDSSYEYVPGQKPGVFYFETEDGNEYKVDFSGNNKKTEIAFAQRGQGDEHKTGLTGTGNSRKIFGTVINIVKDYMSKIKPDMLIFNANNSEPSRVRLYKMLANQADSALPDYNFAKALSDGTYTTYYLTRNDVKVPALDKIKAAGFKALDKIVGEEDEPS